MNNNNMIIPGDYTNYYFNNNINNNLPLDLTYVQNNILFPTPTTTFLMTNNNNINVAIPSDLLELSPTLSSTSDESEEHLMMIRSAEDERKQRRMVSNRESARRSRMRKKRHLDELWSQVVAIKAENQCLIDKLNMVCENHHEAVRENARLKEEASGLRRQMLLVEHNGSDDDGDGDGDNDPFSDLRNL